ncbi:hypothetical protein MIND_00654600 [Mycena indigotica]|uniref:Uncharacterized protein n=1 Tax=Mycena indigotica TaxID=2126181 RepID=A0A8H6SSR6_9AGAR|nr:uncharacterized protein MIND_00654600 [Mycena indigotica]KAF7304222.1 hypothetical protein MIND_00654600 [Mycena indigotica]
MEVEERHERAAEAVQAEVAVPEAIEALQPPPPPPPVQFRVSDGRPERTNRRLPKRYIHPLPELPPAALLPQPLPEPLPILDPPQINTPTAPRWVATKPNCFGVYKADIGDFSVAKGHAVLDKIASTPPGEPPNGWKTGSVTLSIPPGRKSTKAMLVITINDILYRPLLEIIMEVFSTSTFSRLHTTPFSLRVDRNHNKGDPDPYSAECELNNCGLPLLPPSHDELTSFSNFVLLPARRLEPDHPADQTYQPHELLEVHFKDSRIYTHATMRLNYTTYDLQRDQDMISPRTHPDLMLLSTDPSDTHPYEYARVVAICHANVKLPATTGYKSLEFLFIRRFERDTCVCCIPHRPRNPRLHFVDYRNPDAFGFIDPAVVVRASYVIPAFASGTTTKFLPPSIIRPDSDNDEDYHAYYVNGRGRSRHVHAFPVGSDWTSACVGGYSGG